MAEPKVPARDVSQDEFVVEVSDDRNRNVLWPIDQRLLRGRWTKVNLPGVTFDDRFVHMPDLPGVHLAVNVRQKVARVMDPLNAPQFQEVKKKAQTVIRQTFGAEQGPEDDTVLRDMTADELKTWCYWIRRMLDAKQCIEVRGEVPTMEEIATMPGLVSTQNHDTSPLVQKMVKELPRYVPMRHPEKAL